MLYICRLYNHIHMNKQVLYGYSLSVWFYEQAGEGHKGEFFYSYVNLILSSRPMGAIS